MTTAVDTKGLIRSATANFRRPKGMSRGVWNTLPMAAVNFACDAVDNLREEYPGAHDDLLEALLMIGLRHRFAGGERDVV